MDKAQKPVLGGMNVQVIRSQSREFDDAPAKHFHVSHCHFKVDSAQTRISKQQWGYR
jgi:hypothetical protein